MTQRVFITGGASGIGRITAEAFLNTGAEVAICDADPAAVKDFEAIHPGSLAMVADVTDQGQMADVCAAIDARWDVIDVVCANAGTGGPAGPIEALDYADWQACVATSLHGAFLTCRWAAPKMKAQGSGLITLTSSTAGLFGYPMRSPYAATKWAIIGLMKTLAMELGPHGIRVNAICPGAVEGPRMDRVVAKEAAARNMLQDEVRDLYVRGVSLRTWVSPEDIAGMILFLASDAGRKISGQSLAIDGHTETLAP